MKFENFGGTYKLPCTMSFLNQRVALQCKKKYIGLLRNINYFYIAVSQPYFYLTVRIHTAYQLLFCHRETILNIALQLRKYCTC